MKVEMTPRLAPRRGGEPKVGNVYSNARNGKPFFRVLISIITREGNRPWNNCVFIHVDMSGEVVGCSSQPEAYVKNHQDLVGKVTSMPTMKIEWIVR